VTKLTLYRIGRNQKFLHNVIQYAELVVSTGSKIRGLPEVLKPVFTHFLLKPNKHYFEKIFVDLGPVVEERKRAFSQAGSSVADEKQESVDLLQWLIVRAFQTGLPEEIDTVMISKRFALVCFAAIHTTSLTSMNLLLDIVSAAPNFNTVANLREEVLKTQRQNNGKWDKASLAKLVQMDSTIRESQRLHSVGSWALHRKVSAKGGVRMPNGLLAPEGSHIAVSAYNIQRDAGNHKDPDTFDPFRFSRSREGLLQLSQNESAGRNANVSARVRASQILKDRNHSAVTTGITHLAFGHGRHACPGRSVLIHDLYTACLYSPAYQVLCHTGSQTHACACSSQL
jgi:cytochrome P450